jgi:Flp pilus assembly pilin Flp
MENKKMRNLRTFMKEEDGMGTVEVILIIVVLISLVALFKKDITSIVTDIMKKIKSNANSI